MHFFASNDLGTTWRGAPSPRSGRGAKQRELAKRVVAKQQVCEADKARAAQAVPHSLCKQWTVWRVVAGYCDFLLTDTERDTGNSPRGQNKPYLSCAGFRRAWYICTIISVALQSLGGRSSLARAHQPPASFALPVWSDLRSEGPHSLAGLA